MRQEKRDLWTPIMNKWQQSGLSQTEFCKQNNIKLDLFNYYKRQLTKKPKDSAKTKPSGFAKAIIAQKSSGTSTLQISLANGAIITGINTGNVSVVKALLETAK